MTKFKDGFQWKIIGDPKEDLFDAMAFVAKVDTQVLAGFSFSGLQFLGFSVRITSTEALDPDYDLMFEEALDHLFENVGSFMHESTRPTPPHLKQYHVLRNVEVLLKQQWEHLKTKGKEKI